MHRKQRYRIYWHDPRNGYCMLDFWDLYWCRQGGISLLGEYPDAGYKIVDLENNRVVRRVNYKD
jgi:hypothetical protein